MLAGDTILGFGRQDLLNFAVAAVVCCILFIRLGSDRKLATIFTGAVLLVALLVPWYISESAPDLKGAPVVFGGTRGMVAGVTIGWLGRLMKWW